MFVNKNKLQLAMANACLNAYDLCRAVGIHYQTYRRMIEGQSSKPATVGRIAKALNIPVTEIIEQGER